MIISSTAYAHTQTTDMELTWDASVTQSFGMPQERLARVAARRAFVEMKQRFMQAAKDIEGPLGASLTQRIRLTDEAVELWRLRDEVFKALEKSGDQTGLHRQELSRQLQSVFHL